MTRLIHIIGPQGSGKSMLARYIVAGLHAENRPADHVEWEAAETFRSNAAIRALYGDQATVVVEHLDAADMHADFETDDQVILVEAYYATSSGQGLPPLHTRRGGR